MIGFDRMIDYSTAYLVRSYPVKILQIIDAKSSVASPYWKGSLAYA